MRFLQVGLISFIFFSSMVSANDYPTVDTVRFVVNCMVDNGSQNEENLYACTCRFDAISSEITFYEYEQVSVYVRNKAMPGEKGGVFRDLGRDTKELRTKFEEAEKKANKACPIARRVTRPAKSK
ncbi:MAG: hypothetical protein HN764_16750 [Gammaproteobacteria bacterium]|jgi:hypothetical protein|nr:hypothetical protein [Gammaproteobacteria bacterium]